ncbi:MAG: chromophore lyase CpcT/CpeT [Planctomycetota bacterium]
MKRATGFVALAACMIAGCSGRHERASIIEIAPQPLADVAARWLEGTFTSAEQAAEDENYFEVVLHHHPIWPERDDGRWFYVEQAVAGALDRPYRQRVYRVWARPSSSLREIAVESTVYELPDPDAFINAWSSQDLFADLDPIDLTKRDGCEVVFTEFGNGWMEGSTADRACASTLRGATYATSTVRLSPDEIRSWDQGWDDADEQVWGAVDGPYVFKRVGGQTD